MDCDGCKYSVPVFRSRSKRLFPHKRKARDHCKFGRKKRVKVSQKCILGMEKRRALCPLL
jgi:hypothetical protein